MANEKNKKNPFSRPSFIIAAVVIGALAIAGVVVGVNVATRDIDHGAQPAPSATTTATPSTESTSDVGDTSVCALGGEELSGTVVTAPQAEWQHQGTISYPTSPAYGPGKTDPEGFKRCFQRSPTGALFMASNADAQRSLEPTESWLRYVVADGPHRETFVAEMKSNTQEGVRVTNTGFRVLAYDGETAHIDLELTASGGGRDLLASSVYELVWQDDDWRISSDTLTSLRVAPIPDTAEYIPWGE